MKTIKINKVDRKIITYEQEAREWERPGNRFLRIVLDKGESIAIAAHECEPWNTCDRIPDEIADLTRKQMHQASVKLNERPGVVHWLNAEVDNVYPMDPARVKWAVYRDTAGKIFRALIHFESTPYNKSDMTALVGHREADPKRALNAKRYGKLGTRPIKDKEKIGPAIARVFELLKTKKAKTMKDACNMAIEEFQLHIKWQGLARHFRKSPQWRGLKKRNRKKTTNVIN